MSWCRGSRREHRQPSSACCLFAAASLPQPPTRMSRKRPLHYDHDEGDHDDDYHGDYHTGTHYADDEDHDDEYYVSLARPPAKKPRLQAASKRDRAGWLPAYQCMWLAISTRRPRIAQRTTRHFHDVCMALERSHHWNIQPAPNLILCGVSEVPAHSRILETTPAHSLTRLTCAVALVSI